MATIMTSAINAFKQLVTIIQVGPNTHNVNDEDLPKIRAERENVVTRLSSIDSEYRRSRGQMPGPID